MRKPVCRKDKKMVDISAILPAFIAFAITWALGPIVIPFLTRLKFGQTERELGVKSHLKKAGTPTMGGVMFICPKVIGFTSSPASTMMVAAGTTTWTCTRTSPCW